MNDSYPLTTQKQPTRGMVALVKLVFAAALLALIVLPFFDMLFANGGDAGVVSASAGWSAASVSGLVSGQPSLQGRLSPTATPMSIAAGQEHQPRPVPTPPLQSVETVATAVATLETAPTASGPSPEPMPVPTPPSGTAAR